MPSQGSAFRRGHQLVNHPFCGHTGVLQRDAEALAQRAGIHRCRNRAFVQPVQETSGVGMGAFKEQADRGHVTS